MKNGFPKLLTPEEVAEVTRTSKEDVIVELESGRLPGFKIGDKWRVLEDKLQAFMAGETNISNKKGTETMADDFTEIKWEQRDSFVYGWPDGYQENYEQVYGTAVELLSGHHDFAIGYTTRKAAGMKDRCRVVVFLCSGSSIIPVVEFAGANDFAQTRQLVSVIKDRNGHHVRSQSQLPPEYIGMPTVIYSDIVVGPYAASGLAVIANNDDRNTMLRHALIRARYKGWIPS